MSEMLRNSPKGTVATVDMGTDTALKKNAIGLPEVLFQAITAMAPAAALSTALTPAFNLAGASVPLAVLLATIACAFIASCIGQLAIHIPSAGGLYTYISRSLGVKTGFLSAWVFLLAQPLLLSYTSLVWGFYLEDLVLQLTGFDLNWVYWTLLGSLLLFGLTYFGIKLSANASIVLGAIEIGIFLVLSISMIVGAGGGNDLSTFTPIHSSNGPGGWTGIFQGMIFAFLIFVGFETAAPLGEETTHPKRNIPRAMIYSAIGLGLFYVLATYASVVGWGVATIAGYGSSQAPWLDLAQKYWGAVGPLILLFAIINSALGNGNAGINATSRVMYAMGRSGTLPAVFAVLSRHRTPVVGILVHTLVFTGFAIGCMFFFNDLTMTFGLIGTLLTLGLLVLYFLSCISTIVFYLRERPADFSPWTHGVVAIVPLIILLFVFASQIYPVPVYPLNLALPVLIGWTALGGLYLVYLIWRKPDALIRGKEIVISDLEPDAKSVW